MKDIIHVEHLHFDDPTESNLMTVITRSLDDLMKMNRKLETGERIIIEPKNFSPNVYSLASEFTLLEYKPPVEDKKE